MVARQTASPKERARTVDAAMMWMELAEWAEGKWPPGKQQRQVQPEKHRDRADCVEDFRFASESRQEDNRS
jgi:hypothetical protein